MSAVDTVFGPATYAAYDEYLNSKKASKLQIPACNIECAPGSKMKKLKTEGGGKETEIPKKSGKESSSVPDV